MSTLPRECEKMDTGPCKCMFCHMHRSLKSKCHMHCMRMHMRGLVWRGLVLPAAALSTSLSSSSWPAMLMAVRACKLVVRPECMVQACAVPRHAHASGKGAAAVLWL